MTANGRWQWFWKTQVVKTQSVGQITYICIQLYHVCPSQSLCFYLVVDERTEGDSLAVYSRNIDLAKHGSRHQRDLSRKAGQSRPRVISILMISVCYWDLGKQFQIEGKGGLLNLTGVESCSCSVPDLLGDLSKGYLSGLQFSSVRWTKRVLTWPDSCEDLEIMAITPRAW
jgi:hypothetical protein